MWVSISNDSNQAKLNIEIQLIDVGIKKLDDYCF